MKKLIIVMVVILCVFMAAAVGITYVGIRLTNEGFASGGTLGVREAGIDLYGTYDENDLIIETLTEEYNGVEIGIPKISGLKNREIQEKINTDMYRRVYELLESFSGVDYASFYTRANFANTISIGFSVSGAENHEMLYLNYELVGGKRLKLEDLFAKNTDILSMVRQGFFEELATMGEYDSETGAMQYDENQLYKTVKNYMEDPDKVFGFSPSQVFLYRDNRMASIEMLDHADKVTVYTKYLTDQSIFERDDIGFEGAFTCADISYELFDKIEYGYMESNLWYDVTAWRAYVDDDCPEDRRESFVSFKEEVYEKISLDAEKYRERAKQNPDKFYIVLEKPSFSMYAPSRRVDGQYVEEYSDAATLNHTTKVYEMDRDYFETTFKDELIKAYRYQYFAMAGGAYLYVEENPHVKETSETIERMFNYVESFEYTQVSQLFKDDSYRKVIEDEAVQWLMANYNYDEENAREKTKQMQCHISTWGGIKITFPDIERHLIAEFDEFDKNTLDFFN